MLMAVSSIRLNILLGGFHPRTETNNGVSASCMLFSEALVGLLICTVIRRCRAVRLVSHVTQSKMDNIQWDQDEPKVNKISAFVQSNPMRQHIICSLYLLHDQENVLLILLRQTIYSWISKRISNQINRLLFT